MEVVSAPDGSPRRPEPANTNTVAPKVTWGTLGAGGVALLLTLLGALITPDQDLIPGFPDWAVVIIGTLLPGLSALGLGYAAPHQWRVRQDAQGGAAGSTEVG